MVTLADLSAKAVKQILFIFNLMFVVSGVILILTGLSIKAFFKEYEPFIDDKYLSASALLILSGSIIFIIAFFGCCGAYNENRYMILTFSILLTGIMFLELGTGVTGYVLSDKSTELLESSLNQSMYKYNSSKEMAKLWDTVQTNFECCGVNGSADWPKVLNGSLPVTCCSFPYGSLDNLTCSQTSENLFKKSCRDELAYEVKENSLLIGSVALAIVVSQILGILLSWYLANHIRSSSYESV